MTFRLQFRLGRVCLAFFLAMGLTVQANAQDDADSLHKATVEMLPFNVVVVDPDGDPVEDAVVSIRFLSSKDRGMAYTWVPERFGSAHEFTTNELGIAETYYPKYIRNDQKTEVVAFLVQHSDFVLFAGPGNVNDGQVKFRLQRGFRIAVNAVDGESGIEIKTDLYAVIDSEYDDWKLHDNGMLVSPVIGIRDCTMRVVQLTEGKPALFSKTIRIEPGNRRRILLNDIPLSPGTRVDGQIDKSVPRPVKNGRVAAIVVRRTGPDERWNQRSWHAKTSINEDGSFVFESLPPGDVLLLMPFCDGWVPAPPNTETVLRIYPEGKRFLDSKWMCSDVVALDGVRVTTRLAMEKASSIRVTVLSPEGKPLPGAKVSTWPSQRFFGHSGDPFSTTRSQREILIKKRSAVGLQPPWIPPSPFGGVTNANGVVNIKHLSGNVSHSILVKHDELEMVPSTTSQDFSVEPKPGETATIVIRMQAKGTDAPGATDGVKEEDKQ